MQRLTTTSFGRRPVTAGQLAARAHAEAPALRPSAGKWQIFRDLTAARLAFGLSGRTLTVLNALLSFLPGDTLDDSGVLIVFPSNRTLALRAHGMAEATLRRHIAALVEAGLIARHDSPNGKRYAARDRQGRIAVAFGFDLRPLLTRAGEIAGAAQQAADSAEALRRQREAVVLGLRDVTKLIAYATQSGLMVPGSDVAEPLSALRRALRRRLSPNDLSALAKNVERLRGIVDNLLETRRTASKTSGSDSQNERHYHNSDNIPESESCQESRQMAKTAQEPASALAENDPPIPLHLVQKACSNLSEYLPEEIRHWRDFLGAVNQIRPWLGISAETWGEATTQMGHCNAAIVTACILQRADRIASPGAYLRTLTRKSAAGSFSPGPMVMALLNAPSRRAA
ncbi:plasmid replication protein RepC [Tropicimonas sp.]|uniref:plasmid replication protein RepC n=1 Tax=Tropicimonas sp. TaxID=2067044 RepID=UPI003A860DC6